MADGAKSHPILIPPLSRETAHLELVRDRLQAHRAVQHPHCDEHFLFTPHCAACLEAERTQSASALATPIDPQAVTPKAKPQSSRSFGFKDNLPMSLVDGSDSFANQWARQADLDATGEIASAIVDSLLDI